MHRLHLCHDPSQLMAGVSCPGDFIPTLLPTTACDSMPARHLLRKSYPASCVVFRTRSSTRLDSTARLCHFPYSLEYETRLNRSPVPLSVLARVRDSTQPLACATFRTCSSTRPDSTQFAGLKSVMLPSRPLMALAEGRRAWFQIGTTLFLRACGEMRDVKSTSRFSNSASKGICGGRKA